MKHEGDGDTNCIWFKRSPETWEKTGGIGNQSKNPGHPKKFAVIQFPVKEADVKKIHKELNNDNNNNNNNNNNNILEIILEMDEGGTSTNGPKDKKTIDMHNVLHQRDDINRPHVSRNEGGREESEDAST